MKGLIFASIFATSVFAMGEERSFGITYAKDEDREQIPLKVGEQFQNLLKTDKALSAEFEKLQEDAKERAGGRYSLGRPQFLVLPRSESVDFADQSGTREFKDVVVIYFPFSEGERRGRSVTDGTFVKFRVSGLINYEKSKDDFAVKTSNVVATFAGFSSSLNSGAEP